MEKRIKKYKVYEINGLEKFEDGNSLRGVRSFDKYQDAEQFIENTDSGSYNGLTILTVWE